MADMEELTPDYSVTERVKNNVENLLYHVTHFFDPPVSNTTIYKQITDSKDVNKELLISYEALQAKVISLEKQIQDYEKAGRLTEVVDIKKELLKTIKQQKEFHEQYKEMSIIDLAAWAESGQITIVSKDNVPLGTMIDFKAISENEQTKWVLVIQDYEGKEKRFNAWKPDDMFDHFETLSMQFNMGRFAVINYNSTGHFVQDIIVEHPETMKRENVNKVLKDLQQSVNRANQNAREATHKYEETLREKNNTQDLLDVEKAVSKSHLKSVQAHKEMVFETLEASRHLIKEATGNLTSKISSDERQRILMDSNKSLRERVNELEGISHNEINQKLLGEHSEVVGDIQDRAIKMMKASPSIPQQRGGKQMVETTTEEVVPHEGEEAAPL